MTTYREIAEWMLEELKREKYLYQEMIVYTISSKFGDEYISINGNGNMAIDTRVLHEFRKITENTVVWSRSDRFWRFREDHDDPNKRQVE